MGRTTQPDANDKAMDSSRLVTRNRGANEANFFFMTDSYRKDGGDTVACSPSETPLRSVFVTRV